MRFYWAKRLLITNSIFELEYDIFVLELHRENPPHGKV